MSDLEWLLYVHTTPDTPGGLRRALHCSPLERLDLVAGGVQEQLNLLLDACDFEPVQGYYLVAVVYWERTRSAGVAGQHG